MKIKFSIQIFCLHLLIQVHFSYKTWIIKLELVDKNNFVIYTFENKTDDVIYNKSFVYDYKDTLGNDFKKSSS
jgi:hypothetical protein